MLPKLNVNKIKNIVSALKVYLYSCIVRVDILYVVEGVEWSIFWDGQYITNGVNMQGKYRAAISPSGRVRNVGIIHFGSINTFRNYDPSSVQSKIIVTWFHVDEGTTSNELIEKVKTYADLIHTSCESTREKLVTMGIDRDRIVVIPIGVDTTRFKPVSAEERKRVRDILNIPEGKVVIGSFHKDGNGWGEGLEPKLIKGPDVLCEVLRSLDNNEIHVLLTGPARGYVKRQLSEAGIEYTHVYLKNYNEISQYYNAIDCYIVPSREEGGPKGIVESLASSIPVVSSSVGMAPDIEKSHPNSIRIAKSVPEFVGFIQDKEYLNMDKSKLREVAMSFDWKNIAIEYQKQIYDKVMGKYDE